MIGLIVKLVRTITFKRVVVYTLAVLIAIVLYTMYEQRNRIFMEFSPPQPVNPVGFTFSISKDTEEVIREKVNSDRVLIGMGVLSADLRLNEARLLFFHGDNPVLSASENILLKDGGKLPMFTSLEEDNIEIIHLINGQFTCIKFNKTVISKLYPDLNNHVKMACRASIPSYYGYFAGFISAYLSEELSPERQEQLKLSLNTLATTVYFRDVIPTQRRMSDTTPLRPR